MTQAVINTGTFPNDATGDPALTAFTKINSNFTQLFGGTFTYPSITIGPPTSGTALTVTAGSTAPALDITGVANAYAERIFGSATVGQSLGLIIKAGTNASDFAIAVQNQASATMMNVNGVGNVLVNAPASGVALTVNGVGAATAFQLNGSGAGSTTLMTINDSANANGANILLIGNGGSPNKYIRAQNGIFQVLNSAYSAPILSITDAGATSVSGAIGINGVTPPAQSTGWGTPTNAGVVNNFAGSAATLASTGQAVAQIIIALKALGLLAA